MNIIHKVLLALSNCLCKWIKVNKWDYFYFRSQEMEICNQLFWIPMCQHAWKAELEMACLLVI